MGDKEFTMSTRPAVLVIDDDQDFQASVKALLESLGYAVLSANSGKEGLREVLANQPDLIMLDVMMECDTEGYGVTQALKYWDEYAASRHIPILMVSSIQETPDERFPMVGEVDMIRPDCYLTKPLDIPKFLGMVERLVPASSRSREVSRSDCRRPGETERLN
jgi:CheY-like chemotaxis protein